MPSLGAVAHIFGLMGRDICEEICGQVYGGGRSRQVSYLNRGFFLAGFSAFSDSWGQSVLARFATVHSRQSQAVLKHGFWPCMEVVRPRFSFVFKAVNFGREQLRIMYPHMMAVPFSHGLAGLLTSASWLLYSRG